MKNNSVEKVLAPFVIGAAHQAHDVAASVEIEGAGLAHEFHSRFAGELIAFAAIAWMTAGDKILPGGSATARTGHYVVEGQLA